MADRKISELNQASRVYDADYMVVVTGIDQTIPGQTTAVEKVTTKFPLSGLATWVFRVNEVVSGVSGIKITPSINNDGSVLSAKPNTVLISTTGVSYDGHTHTSNNITDFNAKVNSLVKQDLKFLNEDVKPDQITAPPGTYIHLTGVGDTSLEINLAANSKYVCELGLIVSGDTSNISGYISTTGTRESNYSLLGINGTWNYLSGTPLTTYNSSVSVTGEVLLANNIAGVYTLINKFSVNTYLNSEEQISVSFTSDNVNGAILKGSWLKAEKVI